eukprot:133845_1
MATDEDLNAELDCIISIYEKEVVITHNNGTGNVQIQCNINFTNTPHEIIVYFMVNETSTEISVENTKQSAKKLPHNIITKIQSKLQHLHTNELNNMPIFQCISYIYTELIDDKNLLKDENKTSNPKQIQNKLRTSKKQKQAPKSWWLTIGSRIEYKYKQKNWKNGAITRVSNSNKVHLITIKYWKNLSVQKYIELTEENVLELIQKHIIRQSNIIYPLWIHTHSPIWISQFQSNSTWRPAKIIHYIDGKHIMIEYSDCINDKNNKNNTVMFDKNSSINVQANWINIYTQNKSYIIEPFSIYWNAYTRKYLTNIYTTNVIYNTYYNMIYNILNDIPIPVCTIIIDYLGFDAINMSPMRIIKSEYKLWNAYKNDCMVGVEFSVKNEIQNVFGIEMDVNVSSFGQVFGLLNSAAVGYYFWREKFKGNIIDNYSVEMLDSDEWKNSDYLRMFFFENKNANNNDDEVDGDDDINQVEIRKPVRVNLKPNRTYRLAFATRTDLPIFYWRDCYYNRVIPDKNVNIKSISCGAFTIDMKSLKDDDKYLFQSRYKLNYFSLNFRILIA